MRRSLILHAFALASLAVLQSCRPDYTAESNAVGSMLGVLTKVEETSNGIDPRLVRQYARDVKEKCEKIQSEMTDTVDLQDARILIDFCALNGHFRNCLQRKEMIDAELKATRNQLFNLQTDLKEKSTDRDSVTSFVKSEFQYVEGLDEGIERVVLELNGCFETYAELKDDIDRLIISLPVRNRE